MTIKYEKRDITTVTNGILAHGVNCLGVMGSGVAGAIRSKWPKVFQEYSEYWNAFDNPNEEMLGIVQVVDINDELKVANCFTQVKCGNDGKRYANLDAVQEALEGVFAYADTYDLQIFLPRIGCGLGGLKWDTEVEPIIKELSEEHPHLLVTICDI